MSADAQSAQPHLTEENLRELQSARLTYRKIKRAIGMARLDGFTLIFFGVMTLLFSIGSVGYMLGGILLTTIGALEIRGAFRLQKLDPFAAKMLGFNQIALAIIVSIYIAIQIHAASADMSSMQQSANDESMKQLGLDATSMTGFVVAAYDILFATAILGIGALSLYYFTRKKHIERYISETPAWIISMQQAGMSI